MLLKPSFTNSVRSVRVFESRHPWFQIASIHVVFYVHFKVPAYSPDATVRVCQMFHRWHNCIQINVAARMNCLRLFVLTQ